MKGTDHIDKNGEGLFVLLVDGPLWCIDKVKSIFKHVVKKYHPLDVFFGSIIGSIVLVITAIAVIFQMKALMVILVIVGIIGSIIYGVSRWYDFINRKSKEYNSE